MARFTLAATQHFLFLALFWVRPVILLMLKMGAYLAFALGAMGLLGHEALARWAWILLLASFITAAARWWYDTLLIKLAPPGTKIGNRWR